VSMFLCIIEKTDNLKLHNNSELIDLYVENMLDKQKLSEIFSNVVYDLRMS
jgi:hypothetical protein